MYGIRAEPHGSDHAVRGRSNTTVCGKSIGDNWLTARGIWTADNLPTNICEACARIVRHTADAPADVATAATSTEQPEHILQFFEYQHLPPQLRVVSMPFGELALMVVDNLPRNPERTVALRKLLEAKDAAVRAALAK